eukprot:gene23642-9170_t
MHLYNLTLSRPTGIQSAVYGNFSGPKAQELVVSRGKVLELLRPNENGKLQTIVATEVFGAIRSVAAFRMTGAQTDYIIVGSDSGRIVILKYHKDKNTFQKVHQETFGRSGCRRIVPGQHLAVDPKGRACMISAIEKQKFVYILNRDSAANLTISSPLEAHKSHNLAFTTVGLDCGFDNPIFAAIELDYSDADQDPTGEAASMAQKHLTFYELDLGLNHVSEYGDIYKVTLGYDGETVQEVKVKVFDTIPPCTSICVLKTGFLFAASEFGNHSLYQFVGTGEDEDDVESSSAELVQTEDGFQPVFFDPRSLKNLVLVDELSSLMPITDMKIPQIYSLCGRGPRSTLAVMRPGLAVTELAVSPLPGNPTAVWTVKRAVDDEFDAYIVVSFTNATLVFSIGEEVKETNDSGFLGTVPTLHAQLLSDSSMLQLLSDSSMLQVAIALAGGEVVYFELDAMGQLLEMQKSEMSEDVSCMDIAPVPEGRARCRFLALGSYDSTVKILSLDPGDELKVLALQAIPAVPESALMLYDSGVAGVASGEGPGGLFLHVGLTNGVLMRTEVDRLSGQLSDSRSRFLGTRGPKLFSTNVRGTRSMLALSSRPWLGHSDMGRFSIGPLSYEALDHASVIGPLFVEALEGPASGSAGQVHGDEDGFASDQCPEGFVAVVKNTLRILTVENVGETFNQQVTRLRYTPRKLLIHPEFNTLVIAESDHGAIPLAEREDLAERAKQEGVALQGPEFDEETAALEEQFGSPCGQAGQWACCLRLVEPTSLSTVFVTEMDNNETVTSMCMATFNAFPGEHLLCVGTAQGMKYFPTDCDAAFLRVYRMLDDGKRLELLHRTAIDISNAVPGAMEGFKGRLLVGVGGVMRIYEMGKKKMLRKCEYKRLPHSIMSIQVQGSRIIVGDSQESVHMMRYKKGENALYIFADDTAPRFTTAVLPLDYNTIACADKFGNVAVLRLPPDVSAAVDEDPTGGKLAIALGKLGGAPNKLEPINNFHVGDTITSMQRASLQPGGQEVIIYATVMGSIGALYPFTSREDVDFFTHLEMHLRQEGPPLCGRDHMSYRSSYFPVKDCVDGDLCAQFPTLPPAKQKSIAEELDRTTGEVLKKLEDIQNKIL